MCGKCEPIMAKVGCVSIGLGLLALLCGVIARLAHWTPMGIGGYSFAAGSGLLFLLSIAIHTCKSACHDNDK